MTNYEYVTNLALFLVEKTGSTTGCWGGQMTAKEQRALFGRFLGKGTIVIDGNEELVWNRVKVCFGLDWDDRNITDWKAL